MKTLSVTSKQIYSESLIFAGVMFLEYPQIIMLILDAVQKSAYVWVAS